MTPHSMTYVEPPRRHIGPVHMWAGREEPTTTGPVRVAECGQRLPVIRDDGAALYQHERFPHDLGLPECHAGCWL